MKRTALFLTAVLTVLLGVPSVQARNYGESLEETDQRAVANTFQYALENNKSGTAATWNNPDSAHSGSTVPLKTFQTAEGVNCREYQQVIIIGGKKEQGYGTACRQPDGSWRIVDPDSLHQVSPEVSKEIVRTYRYYDPWAFAYPYSYTYFPHHISFSFGFIHRDGHYFSGQRHYRGNQWHFREHRDHFRRHKGPFRGNRSHLRGHR